MLAAFGFFYNAVKDRIDAADAAPSAARAENPEDKRRAAGTVRNGRQTASLLALVALVVFALLASYLVHEIEAAIDVGFALAAYSTLDVIFVVLAFGWLGLAALFGWRARKLTRKLRDLEAD